MKKLTWYYILVGGLLAGFFNLSASAKTFGLVVGINQYHHVPPLKGAVNDARAIQTALAAAGITDVVVLLNEQATRQAILNAWNRQIAKAKSGDTLIFTYAGHGAQEPERIRGSEADGKDDVLILGGFQETRPGNGQRIIDNELHQLFQAAAPINIVFVADACYSGDLTRSIDKRAHLLGSRTIGSYGPIEDDELPRPAVSTKPHINQQSLPNVIFLSAGKKNQKTPEFLIEGQPHGALSWAFAQALRGAADRDRNQQLSWGELQHYVETTVLMYSEARQTPHLEAQIDTHRAVLPSAARLDERLAAAPVLRLQVLGSADLSALFTPDAGIKAAQSDQIPDLTWDTRKQHVLSSKGDIVAYHIAHAAAVHQVAAKWRLLETIKTLSAPHSVRLRLNPDNSLHRQGSVVSIMMDGHRYRYLTLFNLASDGTVQFLYPLKKDTKTVPGNRPFTKDTYIRAPFGADHLVAIVTPQEPATLQTQLRGLNNRPAAKTLDSLLRNTDWGAYQMGVLGLYTAPRRGL